MVVYSSEGGAWHALVFLIGVLVNVDSAYNWSQLVASATSEIKQLTTALEEESLEEDIGNAADELNTLLLLNQMLTFIRSQDIA